MTRDPRYERWRWTIFGITWLAYVGFYFTRKEFSVAKPGLLKDPQMGMDEEIMGYIEGGFGVAYALGQFLWGYLGDRYGSRIVVLIGMIGSIAVSVAMGLTAPLAVFGVLWFFQGLCQASGWAPLTKNVSHWTTRRERGRVFGFWSTNYAAGGMMAGTVIGLAVREFGGWRYAFFAASFVLAVITLLFFLLQRNRPTDLGLPSPEQYRGEPEDVVVAGEKPKEEPEGSIKVFLEVISNAMILRMAAVYFLLKPIRYVFLSWGTLIVSQRLATDDAISALVSSAFEAGGPLGVITAGFLSDRLFRTRRMPVTVIGLVILSLLLFSFNSITASGDKFSMIAAFAAIGFFLFGPDAIISSTAAVDFGTKKGAGTAVGFINGMGSIGQIIGLMLPGILKKHYGWDVLFTGMGCFILLAAILLAPKWNAMPATSKSS
jgi:OPA family sugar phosphate sensor protein UhpC-like MFS transporter